jgi:hypoxanthine phosphoribosyltransferase
MILRTLYTASEVQEQIERLADEIARDHAEDIRRLAEASSAAPGEPPPGGRGKRPARRGTRRSGAPPQVESLSLPPALGTRAGSRVKVSPSLSLERPILIGILKGTFMFIADLARALKIPADVDFMRARVDGHQPTSQTAEFDYEPEHLLADRSVIVVEDVAGTGRTLRAVLARLQAHRPLSLRVCALVRRRGYCGPPIDYVGFEVGRGWLVGYGLDDREAYRNLPGLCVLED